ncbi:type III-B CRISPR module-associated protein Cmr5 [Donghicola mangrovi]|uniref:CRISPR type III-B/RAMP module-associated protein Cmr5 n=1 Tax=Donghicola mangrovi TaxID=2729614 RepID=A0A850Q2X0_9RHOB|nr:type III-B CRISPR module-associated protein Cmr5 [Donghicola mangrovi]NVO23314.1 type III-B CRISPR module-associated protein Cmr5 [Donghicola mangrovi]
MMTLDQRRAKFALEKVNEVVGLSAEPNSAYRAYVRKFPSTVQRNGLMQALALELALANRSGGDAAAHKHVLCHVSAWLVDPSGWGPRSPHFTEKSFNYLSTDLVKRMSEGTEKELIRTQYEMMTYLRWLKTFAEALIPPPEKGNSEPAPEEGV